jgi:hypothetical protein
MKPDVELFFILYVTGWNVCIKILTTVSFQMTTFDNGIHDTKK